MAKEDVSGNGFKLLIVGCWNRRQSHRTRPLWAAIEVEILFDRCTTDDDVVKWNVDYRTVAIIQSINWHALLSTSSVMRCIAMLCMWETVAIRDRFNFGLIDAVDLDRRREN